MTIPVVYEVGKRIVEIQNELNKYDADMRKLITEHYGGIREKLKTVIKDNKIKGENET